MAVSGVVKVGRRDYAVGLYWQPSPSGRVAQAAREAAQQPGQQADFYCVRSASKNVAIPQYGLGQSSVGHKAGLPTLAASLANVQPGSWAGAFRLREGTWVVVVRDDLIAPDGDTLFDNDDAARDRLLQEVSLGGVQRIYAPDGWSVPGSDPTPLPLLLQDRAESRLQAVAVPVKLLMYGAAAIAIIVLLTFLYLSWQADQERIAEEQARIEREKNEAAKNKPGPITQLLEKWQWPPAEKCYDRKWEKKPLLNVSIDSCKQLFTKVDVAQLGWKRGTATCDDGSLSISYSKEKFQSSIIPKNSKVKDDLSSVDQIFTGDALSPRGQEDLFSELEISKKALENNWPFIISRMEDDKPIITPPQDVKDAPPPPPPPSPWRKRSLNYSGKLPPWEVLKYLDGITGVIVETISWNASGWTMDLIIYEKKGG
jgi:hypothetical protein